MAGHQQPSCRHLVSARGRCPSLTNTTQNPGQHIRAPFISSSSQVFPRSLYLQAQRPHEGLGCGLREEKKVSHESSWMMLISIKRQWSHLHSHGRLTPLPHPCLPI